jgi:hypothetical protein
VTDPAAPLLFNRVAGEIAAAYGTSAIDGFLKLVQKTMDATDPFRVFVEWLHANQGDLAAGCQQLGIEPPEEGPELARRLRDAVMARQAELKRAA